MILKEEIKTIIKDYDNIDIYNRTYDYELIKIAITVIDIATDISDEFGDWDYEDIINLCLNIYDVYMYQLGHIEKDYDIKFKLLLEEYPELEIRTREESGYIQAYTQRTVGTFIELYKKYVWEIEED